MSNMTAEALAFVLAYCFVVIGAIAWFIADWWDGYKQRKNAPEKGQP